MATATKKKPRAQKPPTPRERRLIALLPEANSFQEALIAAGFSESTATKSAKRTIERLVGNGRNLSELEKALEKHGITYDLMAEKHAEGLEAYKVISATVIHKSGDKAGDNKEADSKTNDFIDVPDFPARHKHLDTLHKIKGDFTEKVEITGDAGFANILAEALNRAAEAKEDK